MNICLFPERRYDLAFAPRHVGIAGQDEQPPRSLFDAMARFDNRLAEASAAIALHLSLQLTIKRSVSCYQMIEHASPEQRDGGAALKVAIDQQDTLAQRVAETFGNRNCDGGLAGTAFEVDRRHHAFRQIVRRHSAIPLAVSRLQGSTRDATSPAP